MIRTKTLKRSQSPFFWFSLDSVRLPFLEPLFPEGVERGKTIGVFFSPTAGWRLVVAATIASRLQANLRAGIITTMRFPHEICADIDKLGVDAEKALNANMFRIADWYTCVTGRLPTQVPEDMASSLRVADLGVISAKYWNLGRGEDPQANPEYVEFALFDNLARLFSYNDENSCIKFLNTTLARLKQDKRATMCGFATGVLEKRTYSDLKSMCDGVVEMRTTEADAISHTILRVRSFLDATYTKGWYAVKPQKGRVTLVPASEISETYRTPGPNR